ncbi:hypothetical protein KUCAC02_030753, partial [Chaenocephalus aceratus]
GGQNKTPGNLVRVLGWHGRRFCGQVCLLGGPGKGNCLWPPAQPSARQRRIIYNEKKSQFEIKRNNPKELVERVARDISKLLISKRKALEATLSPHILSGRFTQEGGNEVKKENSWNENDSPGHGKNQENDVQKFIDLKMRSKREGSSEGAGGWLEGEKEFVRARQSRLSVRLLLGSDCLREGSGGQELQTEI